MKTFSTPFNVSGGSIASTSDPKRIVEQKIIDVLVTGRLERPTIPEYGAGLQQLVFDNVDELVEADVRTDAASELGARVTGVNIIDLSIVPDKDDQSTAVVRVTYGAPLSPADSFTFQVSPSIITEESPI